MVAGLSLKCQEDGYKPSSSAPNYQVLVSLPGLVMCVQQVMRFMTQRFAKEFLVDLHNFRILMRLADRHILIFLVNCFGALFADFR